MTSENTTGTDGRLGHVEAEKPTFDTPGEGELQDVDDVAVQTAREHVGQDAAQPDEHPYDADADPDSEPTAREQADSKAASAPSGDGMHYDRSPVQRADDDRRFDALRASGKDAMTIDPGMPAAAPRAGG